MHCAEPSRRLRTVACRLTSILALALVAPGFAAASITPMTADLENGSFSQFSQTNASAGTLSLAAGGYGDATSAAAVYSGGGQNGFARGIFDTSWVEGDDVWYSAAYYLPEGFHASMQGQVALMRWDDWPSHPVDRASSGIVIWGRDKRARLVRELLPAGSSDSELSPSFELPEGRWFWLEVHQRLSSGSGAVNEVYLDGALIGRTTSPNTFAGRVAERMRYGIVAVHAGVQTNPLSLSFDRATVSSSQVGPVAGLAQPPSTSTSTAPPPPPSTSTSTSTPTTSTTSTSTSTTTTSTKKRARKRRTVRVARVTPSVRKCVRRALKRASKRGSARGLGRATDRCVDRYGRLRVARRRR